MFTSKSGATALQQSELKRFEVLLPRNVGERIQREIRKITARAIANCLERLCQSRRIG